MREFDMAKYINTPEDVYGFLNALFNQDSSDDEFIDTWDMLCRSEGMAKLLKQFKQNKAILQQNKQPTLMSILNTLKTLGLSLQLVDKKSAVNH